MNRLKEYIEGTGWAKLAAVVSIVGGAFTTVVSIVSLALAIFTGISVINIVVGALGISFGILTLRAGIKLWRTANNLEIYKNTGKEEDLRDAIDNLSAYFTLIGWITAIGLAVLALVIIAILVLSLWFGSATSSMPGLWEFEE
jgi:predicted lysophospholipase L1 biosynthesis ABC-type transport system permease subunit